MQVLITAQDKLWGLLPCSLCDLNVSSHACCLGLLSCLKGVWVCSAGTRCRHAPGWRMAQAGLAAGAEMWCACQTLQQPVLLPYLQRPRDNQGISQQQSTQPSDHAHASFQ